MNYKKSITRKYIDGNYKEVIAGWENSCNLQNDEALENKTYSRKKVWGAKNYCKKGLNLSAGHYDFPEMR